MYKGIAIIVKKGDERLILSAAHNLPPNSPSIRDIVEDLRSQGHDAFPYDQMLYHPGTAEGCLSCKSAIEEDYERVKEDMRRQQSALLTTDTSMKESFNG